MHDVSVCISVIADVSVSVAVAVVSVASDVSEEEVSVPEKALVPPLVWSPTFADESAGDDICDVKVTDDDGVDAIIISDVKSVTDVEVSVIVAVIEEADIGSDVVQRSSVLIATVVDSDELTDSVFETVSV